MGGWAEEHLQEEAGLVLRSPVFVRRQRAPGELESRA